MIVGRSMRKGRQTELPNKCSYFRETSFPSSRTRICVQGDVVRRRRCC
jgi:hypothetical protein